MIYQPNLALPNLTILTNEVRINDVGPFHLLVYPLILLRFMLTLPLLILVLVTVDRQPNLTNLNSPDAELTLLKENSGFLSYIIGSYNPPIYNYIVGL